MARPGFRSRPLAWVGAVLCVVALVTILVPIVRYAGVALSDDEVRLDGSAQQVHLPAGETWGIYVNDADNSGYSERCSAVDTDGQRIRMRDPWWTISGSDTEMLDFVFDTGSGELTITCSVPGEEVTLREVPDLKAVAVGVLLGGVLGALGLILILRQILSRPPPQPTPP